MKHLITLLLSILTFTLTGCDSDVSSVNKSELETSASKQQLTLNGSETVDLYVGESYLETGATIVSDREEETLTSSIMIINNVDTSKAGTYTVTYYMTDNSGGRVDEITRTVIVREKLDQSKPTLTLNGLTTVHLYRGDTYQDAGATANDETDGVLNESIIITHNVNTTQAGTYTVTYNVNDQAGNKADEVTRTVIVEEKPLITTKDNNNSEELTTAPTPTDTIKPTITLNGTENMHLYVGESYEEPGVTADDNKDGVITDQVIVVNGIDTTVSGTYTVTYNVNDSAGNSATQVARTVTVSEKPDTTKPIISLNGSETVNLYVGDSYKELGAIANDNKDGVITDKIAVVNSVDTTTSGTYTVTYSVNDNAGNAANQVARTVTVSEKPDTTKPTITLNGSETVNLYVGDDYEDQGATANDNKDGVITDKIAVVNSVDTTTSGTYTVTYNVNDNAGNAANQVARTVTVSEKPDTTKPTITLNGSETVNFYVGDDYEDQGAIANDNKDGVITDKIAVVNSVDTTAAGTYTVTYNTRDSAGNQADEVIRTIIVSEDPATICTPVETLDYGVKGDGVTDDTSALNRAFATEKNLCLSKNYKINGTLSINGNDMILRGGGVLFRGTRNTNEILKLVGNNITIKDLEFDGKDQTPHGITILEHSSNITFDNINMHNYYARSGDGATLVLSIAGDNCHNIFIQNSSFSNLDGATDGTTGNPQGAVRAIYANTRNSGTTSNNIYIENNTFENIKTLEDGDAIHFQGTIRNTASPYPHYYDTYIRDNTFINCIKRAIKVQAGHIVVENNTIQVQPKMFTPIELFGNYNIVRNNYIDVEHAISGITVKGAYNSVEDNTVIVSKTNHYTQYGGGSLYGMINLGDNNSFTNNRITTWAYGYMEKRNTEPGVLNNPMVENTKMDSNIFNNCQLTFTETRGLQFTNNEIHGKGSQQYYGIYYSSSGYTNFNNSEIMANNIINSVNRGIIIKSTSDSVRNSVKNANSFESVNTEVSGS